MSSSSGPDPAVNTELTRLRHSIDNLDAAMIHLLAERFACTRKVGYLKAACGLPPADLARESEQIDRLQRVASGSGLDPVFAKKFHAFVVDEVIRQHKEIAEGGSAQDVAGADTLHT